MDRLARIKARALKKLMASKEDDWSYLDEAPGMESFGFCRWREVDDEVWEGETIWLRGEVSDARLRALADPEAELTEREAAIWRRHLAHWTAKEPDQCSYAVLIPVRLAGKAIDGYAVFIVGQGHPYATPRFEGAFVTREEAIHHLESEGALAMADPRRINAPAGSLH